MSPSRYCLTLGAAALAIAAAVAAFNYTVDPYLIFDAPRVNGFNALKPAAATRERMMKAYQIARLDANTIVIGSSRPDMGIDPASGAWPAAAQPVYNMGLVGGDVAQGLRYLRHYVAMRPAHPPRTIVVGLDFENDLYVPDEAPSSHAMDETEARLAVDGDGRPNPARAPRVLEDRAQALLSLDALLDSVTTIHDNPSDVILSLQPDGRLTDNAMRDVVRTDGYAQIFEHTNRETVKLLGKPHRVLSESPSAPIRRLAALRSLLAFARQNGSDVVLMIQPAHVSRLELLERMGYWDDFDRWKRALAGMTAQANATQRVVLWDFAGYAPEVLEPAPPKGHGKMDWFWDQLHYTPALGERMIARMHEGAPPDADPGRFGVLLTPQNVEARLAEVRRERAAWRSAMPQESERYARMACDAGACPGHPAALASAR
ncbi:hypothetical protein [Massilia sp. 9096]|uniref:hypothetical protein n=1 Tax=Massilia sp. 9096 TaxID=1500894 RepID=UPI000562C1B3|nr:hypothetical protein [Massilia sp. 9096]